METGWTRRDVLRAAAATAALPALVGASPRDRRAPPSARPTVAVIGAGMAGVSTAWLLDGQRDVVVLESRDEIGGNVRTVDVEIEGQSLRVDLGAQFFHPAPYPAYTSLLQRLGLFPPEVATPPPAKPFPASITIEQPGEATPRFVAPITPGRTWPTAEPWNLPGLLAFLHAFAAAKTREDNDESWSLTLAEWLPTLGLDQAQWEGIILPWVASLFSGDIEQARGLSARASMLFAARALPDDLSQQVVYYVLADGLVEPMRRMLAQCTTVQVHTTTAVAAITRDGGRRFTVRCADGRSFEVDDVVLAASGPATLALLDGMAGTEDERAALRGVEFHRAALALHTDPIYAPADPAHRSFLNCRLDGTQFCEASMWLTDVVGDGGPGPASTLWKSWTTHRREPPTQVLHGAEFLHMLPTPATIRAQDDLRRLQGRSGLWFAGGYLFPYDAQETALRSAMDVCDQLTGRTPLPGTR